MKEDKTKKKSVKRKDKPFADSIEDALIKKALGYDSTETVEEYAADDGEVKLTKKKVTVKNVPPDVTALKILLDKTEKPIAEMTDEELENEKIRLLKILAEEKEQK
ncbi:MAG: hypothetical protein SPL13_03945 [Clostridia bacterium]|nr:hypothetical protein [Clostridia bacterium]